MEGGFPPGTVLLEKYRVESELGRGGMGVVLRVTHLHLGEELAMKILAPQVAVGPELHARFLREAQSAVRLRGEHVARVGDVGVLPGGAPYMVMEYLRGADLAGELVRRGALPPGEVVDYVLQACEALAEAHAVGIVHRDIKPSNLFLTRRPDGSPLVKVLDFGISKAPIGGPGVLTRTDTVMGTPGYMSPEQLKASKDVDARSDIWALGIVLFECLNRRRPFDAETFSATVLRAATEPVPPMDPRLPRGLQAVILRCLEKDRAARYPSTAALATALAPFAKDARSAGIVVERTAAMLPGVGVPAAQASRFGQPPHATTLSGSAGMMRVRSTRRYAVGGVAVVLTATLAVVVVAQVAPATGSGTRTAEPGTVSRLPVTGSDGRGMVARSDMGHEPSRAPDAGGAVAADAASAAAPEPGPGAPPATESAGVVAKAERCAALEVNQQWQALWDCAAELATLAGQDRGVAGKADELRRKAAQETASSVASAKVKDAISEHNLREAQKQLRTIAADSVYFPVAGEAFRAAEALAIEDSRRQAQGLAASNDCAGVKRLQAQVSAASTPGVVAGVAAVAARCGDRARPPPGMPAVAASDPASEAPKISCETTNVDDVMSQAQNQYQAGFATAALQLMAKLFACKQDVRMYRMAAFYACAAHDAKAAALYYAKVPVQYRAGVVQRCQQESITVP